MPRAKYVNGTTAAVFGSRVQGVEAIQLDMMKYGSVTAAFSVYSDFLTYSGGVYSNKTGEPINNQCPLHSSESSSSARSRVAQHTRTDVEEFQLNHDGVSATCNNPHLLLADYYY